MEGQKRTRGHSGHFGLGSVTWALVALVVGVACRSQDHHGKSRSLREEVVFIHPLAKDVHETKGRAGEVRWQMRVDAPVARVAAFYRHKLTGRWQLMESHSEGRRVDFLAGWGRRRLLVRIRGLGPQSCHVDLVSWLAEQHAVKLSRDASVEPSGRDGGPTPRDAVQSRHLEPRVSAGKPQMDPRLVRLVRSLGLGTAWKPVRVFGAWAFRHPSRNVDEVIGKVVGLARKHGFRVLAGGRQRSGGGPPGVRIVTLDYKGRQVVVLSFRKGLDGTYLTVMGTGPVRR